MSDGFELANLCRGLEGGVKAADVLAEAKEKVPGFAEYYDRKNRSKEHLGVMFGSNIIDIRFQPEGYVFCVVGYFSSMDSEQRLIATAFGQGVEHTSKNSYSCTDVFSGGYDGILHARMHPDGQDTLAELIVSIEGKRVHFDIPLG